MFDFLKISPGFHIFFTSPAYREAMTKKRLLTTLGACGAVSLVAGIACISLFISIGSTIGEDGVLHEPFPLLPIGWLFIFGGILSLLVYGIVRIVHALMYRRKDACGEEAGDARSD